LKKVKSVAIFLLLLLCFVSKAYVPVMAYTLGVKSGDWIRYSITVTTDGQTTDAGWVRFDIQNIIGYKIEGTWTSDKVSTPEECWFIVSDAVAYNIPAHFSAQTFIFANMAPGDPVPYGYQTYLQGPVTRLNREALYVTYSSQDFTYWDRQTGVLLEDSEAGGYGLTTSVKLVATSLWGGGALGGLDWWIWIIIIVAVVGGILTALLLIRKRKPHVAQPPPPPPTQIPPPPPPPPP